MIGPGVPPHDALDTVRDLVDGIVDIRPGVIRDFSAARNELLDQCRHLGYDWALMLDTDEGIHVRAPYGPPFQETSNPRWWLEKCLEATPHDVLMVKSADGTYEKERFFRLSAEGHYEGPVHEAFITTGTRGTLPAAMTFSELSKTPTQLREKLERDRDILLGWVDKHPHDPRWWYYLGDTHANLGRNDLAKQAFWECQLLNGWDEEAAWANYRIAEIECREAQYDRALGSCLSGMRHRVDFPELHWLAGFCCYHLGRYDQAIYWAELALTAAQSEKHSPRIGFRFPPAHYDYPWDLLVWSYRALGKDDEAKAAERGLGESRQEREKAGAQ